MERFARVVGWGKYAPERVMSNDELQAFVDTSDEWIRARTGIHERRVAADDETSSTMGARAAERALEQAGVTGADIDLVICATFSPDFFLPSTASLIQNAIGANHAGAFDLNAACSGFVYAFATATQFIKSGAARRIVVVGAEVMSRCLNWADRNTCVLFGDGAAAVVLEATTERTGGLSFVLRSDGSRGELLAMPTQCNTPERWAGGPRTWMVMDGREVFRFAVKVMPESAAEAIEQAGLSPDDIDLFIPHQANVRIIQSAAKALKLPLDRVFVNVQKYGNTSGASVPLALCEAVEEGRIRRGDHLVLVGFGGGLSWGACVVHWDPVRAPHEQLATPKPRAAVGARRR